MAARQRFLMTRIYSHELKPVVYLPPRPKHPVRPAYTKFIPSPAALSFNFALEQYHPMFRGGFSVTSLSDYGKSILSDINTA
ncbi:hypothetical protein, partial [Salmonella sp. s54836]|uniref:hypothetical protein n=1 Tax=Salmonella sp. s54836 TaxID=3159673 RepID=UPI00398045A3